MKEAIIYGCGPTRIQYPGKNGRELWSVNTCYRFLPPAEWYGVDKLFIVDEITLLEFAFSELKNFSCIVAPLAYPELPNIEIYPMQEVFAKFRTKFFSNAICYMIAYALLHEYEKLWFYGIDMMTNSSYIIEKGGVEYWMGIAHALGMPIINTRESATGKTIDGRMYGYWGAEEDTLEGKLVRALGVPIMDTRGSAGKIDGRMYDYLGAEEEPGLPEVLAQETRELIRTLPNMVDESEEWVRDERGDWVRREQKIVKL